MIDSKKRIIDLLVLYLFYSKYSNVFFMIKFKEKLTIHSQHIRRANERYSPQRLLIVLFEKWKENLDKG